MSILFLSHSSKDNDKAKRLKEILQDKGHDSVFLDLDPETGLQAGELWQKILYRRLRSCQALVALVTNHFLESKWCFAEVALARMQGKKLFGIRCLPLNDNPRVPDLLSDKQLIDEQDDLEKAVDRLIRGLEQAGLSANLVRTWDRQRSPYPGFSAFAPDDWGVFFGRDAEIEAGIEIIRGAVRGIANRMVLILGASGSGKSSLLNAGIVHRLRSEDDAPLIIGPFHPGSEPLEELEFSVARLYGLASVTRADNLSLGRWLRRLNRTHGIEQKPVVVFIDQFEELLGRPEGHEADDFLTLMATELDDADSHVSFVGTMRSDQLPALQSHRIGRILEWQSLFIGPVSADMLRIIIEEPARLAELELEKGLTDLLIEDTRGTHALPLLALTLRRLWDTGGKDGLLEKNEYKALGGIQGAVAKIADDAIAGVNDEGALEGLREALLRMVRLDERQTAVKQAIEWKSTRETARPLLERLISSRLLVRENGELQVAHEALFSAWNRLSGWINESRQALLIHQQVADACRLWLTDRLETDLWRGARLERAIELQKEGLLPLSRTEAEFLDASMTAQKHAMEEIHKQELQRQRLGQIALGRGLAYQALSEARDRPQRGLLLAIEAVRATYDMDLPVTAAAETALHSLLNQSGGSMMADLGSKITSIIFEANSERFAAGSEDGHVVVMTTGREETVELNWHAQESAIEWLALAGQRLAIRCRNGVVLVCELGANADAPVCQAFSEPDKEGVSTAFSPARQLLALTIPGRATVIHDLNSGQNWNLEGADSTTTALAFSGDGDWLVDGREDGSLVLWRLSELPEMPKAFTLQKHKNSIKHIACAARALVFVTSDSSNEQILRWTIEDEPDQIQLNSMYSSGSSILDLAISPDGETIVAGTWHSEAFCWRAADNFGQAYTIRGHTSSISSTAISPDGRWIITASSRDNYALLWRVEYLREGLNPIQLRGEDKWLETVAFSPFGLVVAGSWAGTVRKWEYTVATPDTLQIPGVDLNQCELSWVGRLLVCSGEKVAMGREIDPSGKVVDLVNGIVQTIQEPNTANRVAMSEDGGKIAIAGGDQIRVIDRLNDRDHYLNAGMDGWFGKMVMNASGRWLFTGHEGNNWVYDLSFSGDGRQLPEHTHIVSAAFDAEGNLLLTADTEGNVRLWDCRGKDITLVNSREHKDVKSCGFTCHDELWYSVSSAKILTGKLLKQYCHTIDTGWGKVMDIKSVGSNTGRLLIANSLLVASWDLESAEPSATRIDLPRHEGYIDAIAVSESGDRVATSMVDGPIRLWSLNSPSTPVSLPRTQKSVLFLKFVEQDRILISGESHASLEFWELDINRLLVKAAKVAGRKMSKEELDRFLVSA